MKRNVLLIVVAAVLLAACADKMTLRNEVNYNDGEPVKIAFDTYHSKATKAPVYVDTNLTKANGGFGVIAYKYPASLKYDETSNPTGPIRLVGDTINISSVAGNGNVYTNPVFDNTMVYYNYNANTAANFHEKYTYDFPRYWDKEMYYAFFAYAPQDTTQGAVILNETTGLFTFKNIRRVQCASGAQDKVIDTIAKKQYLVIEDAKTTDAKYDSLHAIYTASNNYKIKDYLLAPGQVDEKWHATSQENNSFFGGTYDKANITVGFTFSHLLSRLNVSVKAKQEWNGEYDINNNNTIEPAEKFYGHEYKGIESIYITNLQITNLPEINTDSLESCQQNKVVFDNIYSLTGVSEAVTYNPASYTTCLGIVSDSTRNDSAFYSINGEDYTAEPLYILAGGSYKESNDTITFTNPGNKDIDGYVDQKFSYYIAPNDPEATTKQHELIIDYYISYVNGYKEHISRTINLSTDAINFKEMKPSFVYNIKLEISLDQIYITVDDVEWDSDNADKTQAPRTIVVPTDDL